MQYSLLADLRAALPDSATPHIKNSQGPISARVPRGDATIHVFPADADSIREADLYINERGELDADLPVSSCEFVIYRGGTYEADTDTLSAALDQTA